MKKRLLFLLLILCLLPFPASGRVSPVYYFHSLEVEDGLSQNSVFDVIQDSKGRIWAATGDGVSIYDGSSFKILSIPFDNGSDGGNAVLSLFQDDDDRVYICSGSGLYVYDPVFESMAKVPLVDELGQPVRGAVRSVRKDYLGNIWLAVSGFGLFRMDGSGSLSAVPFSGRLPDAAARIHSLCCTDDGSLWIATAGAGLIRYSPASDAFDSCLSDGDPCFEDIWAVCPKDNNTLFVGCSSEGLFLFNILTRRYERFVSEDGSAVSGTLIHRITTDSHGRTWVCTENGLYLFFKGVCTHMVYSPDNRFSLSDNAVYSVCEDSEGGIWVGTFFGGLNYSSERGSHFMKFFPGTGDDRISGKSISEMVADRNGRLWIGTEDAGLNCFDPVNNTFVRDFRQIDADNLHALNFVKEDELWIGTYPSGLYVLNIRTGATRRYLSSSAHGSLSDNRIYSIFKDYRGDVWVGTYTGLCRYEPETDSFTVVCPEIIDGLVNDMVQDASGNLWVAVTGRGVMRHGDSDDGWHPLQLPARMAENHSLSQAITLLSDSSYRLWIGTEGHGVFCYDTRSGEVLRHYGAADGLPDNVVYKVIEDGNGNIWGSTNHGLFRLDPVSGGVVCFDAASGLPGNQFNYKSGFRMPDGRLLFGGVKGLVLFDPSELKPAESSPGIIFTRFMLFNEDVVPGSQGSPLEKSILYTDAIKLNHKQSVFTIGFSAVNYSGSRELSYFYRLKGLQSEWSRIDESSSVTFSRLKPGRYEFCVKAEAFAGGDPVVEKTLAIRVLPPWYASVYAYIVYSLLLIFLVCLSIKLLFLLARRRNERLMDDIQKAKEADLYNSKMEFFTNITHEIRTPLTLISIPIDEVMKSISQDDPNYENLSMIRRNTSRLLKLVNELLDFRRSDPEGRHPNYMPVAIQSLVGDICARFRPSAAIKGIDIEESFGCASFDADVDEEFFSKIMSNLLGNALKHAGKWIRVCVEKTGQTFRVLVSNDGDAIPASERDRIFEPFVKLESNAPGTGIGLPYARNLAQSQHGSLSLDTDNPFVCFVLELPLHQENVFRAVQEWHEEDDPCDQEYADAAPVAADDSSRRILLVDDNVELLKMLSERLKNIYMVYEASNGKDALEIVEREQIDIVVSDVTMPLMDGFELCSRIKSDLSVSHIPVLLLTSRADQASEVEAFGLGADAYLTKPFSFDVLRARIDNLLVSRDKLKSVFAHSPSAPLESISHSKADDVFLAKIEEFINANLDKVQLDVEEIAAAMNMSRATLYRKLRSVTELTPNDFVRLVRLRKAAELLKAGEYKVNEVAFIVGFSSSSYFAKCFYKQFGVLPKDYR